jgi:outer membrane receptor protein involved in Fe transport
MGYRAVDTSVPCPSFNERTPTTASEGVKGGIGCTVAGAEIYNFTNPVTGAPVTAQRKTSGYDSSGVGTVTNPNRYYNAGSTVAPVLGFDDLEGDDLQTQTSGSQDEYFDHQAMSGDAYWEVNEKLAFKYIVGYTDYFYDRTSDVDLTNNPSFDRQFYVSQETEYFSNELQMFWDPTDKLTMTFGAFAYNAKINQRGDYYDSNCDDGAPCNSRYVADSPVGVVLGVPKVDLFTAREVTIQERQDGTPFPGNCLLLAGGDLAPTYCFGDWTGDSSGDRVPNGPRTWGTDLEYQTRTTRDAYAAYGQGTYSFNEQFALTLGLRWARDELDGYEALFYYSEGDIVPLGFDPATGGTSALGATNEALGFVDTDGTILNQDRVLTTGLPFSQSLFRDLSRTDNEMTWRVNFDWTPTDDDLIYMSATRGTRSGGFNLVFFSANAEYDPETLTAYEIGYKGTILDGAMQLNSAIYYYDYEDVHTFGQGPSLNNPANLSTSTFAVPEAYMIGWDTDFVWLMTDRITFGANFSYTHSEYDSDFSLVDSDDPTRPNSLFDANESPINIKGNQMLRVPEMKGGAWGQYNYPLGGDRGSLEAFASWTWIDKVYFSPYEDERDSADSYSRLDLRTTWRSADDAWLVAGFINNVLDEVGIRQVDRSGEDTNFLRAGVTTEPRIYGVEVSYSFQ